MDATIDLIVSGDGVIRCIYGEELELSPLGPLDIRRASHVEPDGTGQWTADLSPVGGPTLGPFPARSEALAAEIAWLRVHLAGGLRAGGLQAVRSQ